MAGPHKYMRMVVRGSAVSTAEVRTKLVDNVYDFYRISLSGTPVKTQAITAFKAAILTPLGAALSVSFVKAFIDCRFIDDPLDPFLTVADGVNGAVAGDSLPSVNNVMMQLKTGIRLGSNRGAKRHGPIAESSTTLDYLNAGSITLFAAYQTAYLAGFTEATSGVAWLPFLVSAKQSVMRGMVATIVGNPITQTIVNAPLGKLSTRSQTRRATI